MLINTKEDTMRIDKEKLARLSELDDNALWGEIRKMAGGMSLSLPENAPSKNDMQKIRQMLSCGRINPLDAMKIMQSYKRGS